eukprot:scaffold117471_cov10-Tisochrysis_lutea.AAC.1
MKAVCSLEEEGLLAVVLIVIVAGVAAVGMVAFGLVQHLPHHQQQQQGAIRGLSVVGAGLGSAGAIAEGAGEGVRVGEVMQP